MSSYFLQPRSDYLKLNRDQFSVSLAKIGVQIECLDNINLFSVELTFRNESNNGFEADFVFPLDEGYTITNFRAFGEKESLSLNICKRSTGGHSQNSKADTERFSYTEKTIKIPVGALASGGQVTTITQFLFSPKLQHGVFSIFLPTKIREQLESVARSLSIVGQVDSVVSEDDSKSEFPTKIHLSSSSAVSFLEEKQNRDSVERCGADSLSLELSILKGEYDFNLKWRNNSIANSYVVAQRHPTCREYAAMLNFKPSFDLANMRNSATSYVLVMKQPEGPADSEWTIQVSLANRFFCSLPTGSSFNIFIYGKGVLKSLSSAFLPASKMSIDQAKKIPRRNTG
mmetsp:Transcript_9157/g.9939  ORF Transcript_9157/g.9939 Transcript_9157/m.9939 type:complete len:343 (+) Transcript_9157:118-1146(+)